MARKRQTNRPEVEFVITAPEPYGAELAYRARARMTLGVLVQLFSQAQKSIVIAAPFFQSTIWLESFPLTEALQAALRRGVAVDIASTKSGLLSLDINNLRAMAHGRLRLFRPASNIEDERRLGSHAKFCITDNEHAYIGSANLTMPGLSEHLEMGLLVHGNLAHQVVQFWNYLLEIRFFVEDRGQ